MVSNTNHPSLSGLTELTDNHVWFKQLFDLSPDPTWIIDSNRFVECNEAAVSTLGYPSRDELLNVHPSRLSPPTQPDGEDSYAKAERMMTLAQDKGLHRFEWMHTKADGTNFFAEVTLSATQFSGRQLIYCVWRDITERKTAEAVLFDSHERYSRLVENTADLITSVDTEGRFIFVNKSAEVFFGLTPPECIGLSAFDFIHPDDRQTTEAAFRKWGRRPGAMVTFENRQVSRSGAVHAMQWSIVARHSPTGVVSGFDGVATDITGRKQVEASLVDATKRWQTTFDSTQDAICLLNGDQEILQANASLAVLTGLSVDAMVGKHCWEIVHRTSAPIPQCPLKSARASLSREEMELQIGGRWFNVTVDPVLGAAQEFLGAVHVMRDVTEHRKMEATLRESEMRLRDITFSMADWVWEVDSKGVYTYSSQMGFDYFGACPGGLIGKTPFDFMAPDEAQRVAAIFAEIAHRKAPIKDLENWNIKADGTNVCLLTNGVPILDSTGKLMGYRGVDKDITVQKIAIQKLQKYHSLMSTVMESFPGGITVVDSDLRVTSYNNRLKQLMELPDSLLEKPDLTLEDLLRFNAQRGEYGAGDIEGLVRAGLERARSFQPHRFERLRPNGRAIEVRGEPVPGGGFVSIYFDITERKQMEEQIRQLAFYDPLTKLPNRRLLSDRLNQALADSKRSGRYGALMFLDLDKFKALNDTQGHAAGDVLLIQAAHRMKACVREVDTVARLGGDEFVVMVGDLNENKAESSTEARSIAEKIRAVLAEPYALTVKHEGKSDQAVQHQCTASIGVVVFIAGEGSQEDFLMRADGAMYQAKDAGSNLIRFYEPRC